MVPILIGEAFIAVRADTTAFSAQVASAASTAAGAAGTTASKSFSQKFATGATALGKTMTRAVTAPLLGIGVGAGIVAANFETAFSKMTGLAGVSADQLEQFRGRVLDLAGETARSPQELAEALFFIASSGQSGAQALDTLRVSARAASAGLGETQVIADTVTSAMAAYGPETLSAAQATDILVAGVREGKAEADELASGLGNVAPLASQLGISFADLTATIASMTLVGVDVDTAFTNVSAVMSGLLKTTPQSERALESVGLTTGQLRDTIAKPGGLVEAMRMIDTAFQGNDEAMAQVFPNIRALRGVMALLAQDGGQVDDVFKGVTNSTGSLDKAFQAASETSGHKFRQGLADLQVEAIDLGNQLLPVGEKVVSMVSGIADAFGDLPSSVQTGIIAVGGISAAIGPISRVAGAAAGLVDQLTRSDSGLRSFGSFLGGGSFAGNVAKGGLAIGGFLIAAELVGPKLQEMGLSATESGAALGAITGLTFGPWGAVVGGVLGGVAGHFGLLGDAAEEEAARAKEAVDKLTDALLRSDAAVSEQSTAQLTKDWKEAGKAAQESAGFLDSAGFATEKAAAMARNGLQKWGLSAADAATAVREFVESGADIGNLGLGALTKMNVTFEDLNRQLAGGPVVMDQWIARQVAAAQAAGATDTEAAALALTLSEMAPKWVEANVEAARMADANNNASFFVGQLDNNLQSLNNNLLLNAQHFLQTGEIQSVAREQITNAGLAAVQAGIQMREEGVAVEYVNGVLATHAGQLVDQVNQITGGNIPATAAHTASLFGIPPERFTNVHTTADIAAIVVDHFSGQVHAAPTDHSTTFNANTGPARAALQALLDTINNSSATISVRAQAVGNVLSPFGYEGGGVAYQSGGFVKAAGKNKPVAATLHGGEYVLSADVVDRIKKGAPSRGAEVAGQAMVSAPTIPGSIGLHGTGTLEATMVELVRTNRSLVNAIANLERDTRSGDGVPSFLDGRR